MLVSKTFYPEIVEYDMPVEVWANVTIEKADFSYSYGSINATHDAGYDVDFDELEFDERKHTPEEVVLIKQWFYEDGQNIENELLKTI